MKKYITTPSDAIKHLMTISTSTKDKAALKILAEHIDMQTDQDKAQNWLFAKLWLYMFDKNLIHYESSQGAIDSIRMALSEPMENYFKYIKLTFGDKLDETEIRLVLAEKINLMLNDKNFYE